MPHAVTVTLSGARVGDRVRSAVPDAVSAADDDGVVLDPDKAYEAFAFMRDDEELDAKYLVQMCSVDAIDRIDVVYHLASLAQNHIFKVKVPADHEQPEVASVTPLWIGANLQEREIYDLMGVVFTGHPELTRLFLWKEFPGHPLRKDFMGLPGGQKSGLSQFPKQVAGETGGEFRPRNPGSGE
jgi:NADH-quinone oxidoreductase subunit C